MTKINSPDQLPQMLTELSRQRFYGDIHIMFRAGHITRIVTEESQVFYDPTSHKGENFNERFQK